ncbi:hypothetical protein ACIBG0_12260 [Nocardia sp. NPDC050630]|uniref:hypothetical protein n=1 Tax=Nocardia sp. NPDC050630 TaxID=3364321 RepID=UPI0037B01B8D
MTDLHRWDEAGGRAIAVWGGNPIETASPEPIPTLARPPALEQCELPYVFLLNQ